MDYESFTTFNVGIENAVAWVTFDYPPVNIQGLPMLADLNHLAQKLEVDNTVKVVVFQSAHPEIFVAHADTNFLKDMSGKAVSRDEVKLLDLQVVLERISRLPQATIAKMSAEGKGVQAILDGKAEGYQRLVESCGGDKGAAALLLIEKLIEVANVQAKAIQNLPIEKVFVWDGGGEGGGMKNLGQRIMGALPPMHELAKQVGLDLPEFLGKLHEEAKKAPRKTPPAEG